MAHTFTCLYYHIVFGTRFRRLLITPEMRPRLSIARENRVRALTINGMADHAHMLISLNPAIALADAIKEIKAGSSAWMSSTTVKIFKWQEGNAPAFTPRARATALIHDMTVVTKNIGHSKAMGVTAFNPWEFSRFLAILRRTRN